MATKITVNLKQYALLFLANVDHTKESAAYLTVLHEVADGPYTPLIVNTDRDVLAQVDLHFDVMAGNYKPEGV